MLYNIDMIKYIILLYLLLICDVVQADCIGLHCSDSSCFSIASNNLSVIQKCFNNKLPTANSINEEYIKTDVLKIELLNKLMRYTDYYKATRLLPNLQEHDLGSEFSMATDISQGHYISSHITIIHKGNKILFHNIRVYPEEMLSIKRLISQLEWTINCDRSRDYIHLRHKNI